MTIRQIYYTLTAGLIALAIFGCSKSNSSAPTIDKSGKHPAGWATSTGSSHPDAAINSMEPCKECHGSNLTGGISKVSCFSATYGGISCHSFGPSGHSAGFANANLHGAQAKAAAGGVNGFARCQLCHGNDFRGNGSTNKNCTSATCHRVNAPHSPRPWLGATRTHTNTDSSNAPVCAGCHTNGANSTRAPFAGEPVGTTGCFNASLCHGQVSHPAGWNDPGQHGASAKAAPSGNSGLEYCKICHGTDLHGRGIVNSCFSCHTTAPHSPVPWRKTLAAPTGRTHSTTATGNAPTCGGCHYLNARRTTPTPLPAGVTPTCFDNTLCHALVGHTANWALPANHGLAARTAPGPASGFSYCENCHGNGSVQYPLFQGGRALTTCMSTTICHQSTSPHPKTPWDGPTLSHTNASGQNAVVCAICHTAGANLTSISTSKYAPYVGGTPDCFNNTLCHPNLGDCTNCHSTTRGTGRRVVIGAGGVAGGDYALASHHVQSFPVAAATCDICHDQASHKSVDTANGVRVWLTNQDTGARITYDGTGASLEPFCVSCHNGDGAAIQPIPSQPFKDSGDTTAPPNINWTVGGMAHSGTNACYNCHGNSAGASLTATGTTGSPIINGHGSATAKLLQFAYDGTLANTNAANFCYRCHATILTQFGKARHHTAALCKDCHNQHTAKAGSHAVRTNTAGNAINGATGAQMTSYPAFFASPVAGNFSAKSIVSGTDLEATLCFKCHSAFNPPGASGYNQNSPSGGFAMTDIAREFNPANVGNYATTGTANWEANETAGSFHPLFTTAGGNLGAIDLLNLTVASGFNRSTRNLMTCSDCHASDTTTDPTGPHGSAAGFILRGPNTLWNNTLQLVAGGMPAGTFCANCHASNFANSRFAHTDANHTNKGFLCFDCHVIIPHGSQRPGLLVAPNGVNAGVPAAAVTDAIPYMKFPATIVGLHINSYPVNNTVNWDKPNCTTGGACH